MENKVKSRCYKWCFVPQCTNTTIVAPEKTFLSVPREKTTRKMWFTAARRDVANMSNSHLYCCEDHFDLANDLENYMYHKYMNVKIRIKVGVVPHKFDCQRDRKRAFSTTLRSAAEKRSRKQLVAEALATSSEKELNTIPESTSVDNSEAFESTALSSVTIDNEQPTTSSRFSDKAVQVRPLHRSKHVSCNIVPKMSTVAISPIKCLQLPEETQPPLQCFPVDRDETPTSSSSDESDATSDSDANYQSSGNDSDSTTDTPEDSDDETTNKISNLARRSMTIELCKEKPKQYLGIPKDYFWLIDLLHTKSQRKLIYDNILLTLMKIKCNDTFDRLGDQFGMSSSNSSRIFSKSISKVAHLLKPFIYWPKKKTVRELLPIPFRDSYSHVEAIIDCLEIEIEKPTNAVTQALTWSDYKKCNTLKYLISCSPDGFINFISTGYGGRIADVLLFEQCGFLDEVPNGCGVLADRGFKHIKQLLKDKNCELIKPPSVISSAKPSKEEVLETKRIASLRIHIERVIRRVREFESLKPHAVINHNMLDYADDIILIACALVNIQSPIIKTGL